MLDGVAGAESSMGLVLAGSWEAGRGGIIKGSSSE
jgi:hypothetical protein